MTIQLSDEERQRLLICLLKSLKAHGELLFEDGDDSICNTTKSMKFISHDVLVKLESLGNDIQETIRSIRMLYEAQESSITFKEQELYRTPEDALEASCREEVTGNKPLKELTPEERMALENLNKRKLTSIIKVGNTKGIRLPKDYVTALGSKDVVLVQKEEGILIQAVTGEIPPLKARPTIFAKANTSPESEFLDIILKYGIEDEMMEHKAQKGNS